MPYLGFVYVAVVVFAQPLYQDAPMLLVEMVVFAYALQVLVYEIHDLLVIQMSCLALVVFVK